MTASPDDLSAPDRAGARPGQTERGGEVVVLAESGRADGVDELVHELVEALGASRVAAVEVDRYDELAPAARRAVDGGAAVVAAVGGDGSQRAVGTAIAGTSAALGVVPTGTVNLLGKVLGITDVASAAAAIAGSGRRAIDVARCNGHAYLLNTSSGTDAAIVADTSRSAKDRFGRFGYVVSGLGRLRDRPVHVTVDADGERVVDGLATSVLVLNVGERASSRFHLAPDAEPDDGLLDVMVVRPRGIWATVRLGWQLLLRRDPPARDVARRQARSVTVRWARPVPVQHDGDAAGEAATLDFEIDAGALQVCVPS
jgi:diacylglycerol kinase (ATP)